MVMIYKILSGKEWAAALAARQFTGAAIDVADGFIHFSTAEQLRETAARHFAGRSGLVLARFAAEAFGDDLRWDVSRGGALFPHLYSVLDPALCLAVHDLPWDGAAHVFPADLG
jgi:uncharacterized protein (DUF952 family)